MKHAITPKSPLPVVERIVGRRFRHADRKIIATVIQQADKSGYVMLQTNQGHRISRSISSLMANWIEEDEPHEEALECIECLWGVVSDVLPQIGKVALQDYERLNRGAILARKILRHPKPS